MRIVQVLRRHASEYEKKSQRIDFELLQRQHEFVDTNPDITLDYANLELPEAVEAIYFSGGQRPPAVQDSRGRLSSTHRIASFRRRSVLRIIDRTIPRLHRTREDIEWLLFDRPPAADDFARLDAWIDPAVDDNDFDGFVAEALVCRLPVVASRTPINIKRLEKGRTGWLVPAGDANELTHAILAALFKTEIAQLLRNVFDRRRGGRRS